jgi:hypothetical protein
MIDPFIQAHADAKKAVATFLPSLSGPKPPPPPPPNPLAKRDVMGEMVHAASMARHVEDTSARMARGLPVQPPNPPSPQETFGSEIDQVHIRAISAAIAAHPETERAALLHELHENLTKWVASNNGRVVVDGKMEIATSPQSAETLAAKILNAGIDAHDTREQAKKDAALQAAQPAKPGGSKVREGGQRSAQGNDPAGSGTGGPDGGNPQPQVGRGGVAGGPAPNVPSVGTVDPTSGRVITHSTGDLEEAQDAATAAAPELQEKLDQVAASIKGVNVDGVRPKKDKDRAQRKAEADDKPINTHSDLLAGRLAVDSPEAKEQAVDALKSSAPVIDEEDSFDQGDPDYGFRSHDLQVALDNGKTSAEVQIVPQEQADVDEETHPTYEKGRDAEANGDQETADKAKADNREVHDEAKAEFDARNGQGYDVLSQPIKVGNRWFVAVNPK